ncbi:hypothetical protein SRL2020028_55600 [Mycobacterium kiyosense]|uniref:Uncharacterized protein n=2 Tax=Mycobacterium TaxID=1763 RepID=A0AA37Q9M5_9MYCO|nr:hypothetical protein [Mycobacterium kiyosense]GLB86304.1 hypothetical protein SRL2020028_55600 [Mycobacterium kiyosense]
MPPAGVVMGHPNIRRTRHWRLTVTPPKKPRNNARKAAARAFQRETGLSYKQALAAIKKPPAARRVVTATGVDSYSGSTVLSGVLATVQAAMEALEVPPARPEWAPEWWQPSRLTSAWERRNDDAYMILAAVCDELTTWFAIAEAAAIDRRFADMNTNVGAVAFSTHNGAPLCLELPATSSVATLASAGRSSETLASVDRDSGWSQHLLALLYQVRQQLVPFTGAPVDELRAEIDRLVRWLTAD